MKRIEMHNNKSQGKAEEFFVKTIKLKMEKRRKSYIYRTEANSAEKKKRSLKNKKYASLFAQLETYGCTHKNAAKKKTFLKEKPSVRGRYGMAKM